MNKNYNDQIKLCIIDDFFPDIRTGFRVAEYNWYLKNLDYAEVFSTNIEFKDTINEYEKFYPELSSKIHRIEDLKIVKRNRFDVVYTVFLNNAYMFQNHINRINKPFVFSLYPGGGFFVNNEDTDRKLREVFKNPLLHKVIASQKLTYDYIIEEKFISEDKVELIYGGLSNMPPSTEHKKLYKKNKNTFDICFVANKYEKYGKGKGYDIFIDVCSKLSKIDNDIRCHVVGGYGADDLDISMLGGKITFYGIKTTEFFPEFYSNMDIMMSPTRPDILAKGAFDAFPTISAVDAALNGVLVFTTDKLNLNRWIEKGKETCIFKNNEDICIINENVDEIINKILYYKSNLDILYKASLEGQKRFREVYSVNDQMVKRMKILSSATHIND